MPLVNDGSWFFSATLTVDCTKFSPGMVSVMKIVYIIKVRVKIPANPLNKIGISVTNSFSMQYISALSCTTYKTVIALTIYLDYCK